MKVQFYLPEQFFVIPGEDRFRKELGEIKMQLNESVIYESQVLGLESISKRYNQNLEKIFSDRKETYNLFHELIEEIVVYSRPLDKTDIIAGRKKPGQQIPQTLNISFKLPPEVMKRLPALTPIPQTDFDPRKHIYYKENPQDRPKRNKKGEIIGSGSNPINGGRERT